jgi:Fe-Mn family superoxide dismutase
MESNDARFQTFKAVSCRSQSCGMQSLKEVEREMGFDSSYQAKQFNLSGLNGISDQTLEMHFKLYEGYVKETNNLSEKITEYIKDGKVDQEEMPGYSELTRRLGFEYNGMVLHEYYFGNMKQNGTGDPERTSPFFKAAEESFGSYDIWKTDFVGVGKMRGVGWAICYENPANGRLSNHWITLHETGNVAGFNPVLVMDVWEHAFLLDYKPAERPKYIEAFFSNIDWNVAEQRLRTGSGAARPKTA